jgi:hypothetical protein
MAFDRALQDAALSVTKALPAADANNTSNSIDLGSVALGPTGDHIEVEFGVPATPDLTEGDTITLTLQDSADDSSFAAIAPLTTIVVTGAAAAAGGAAASRIIRLPRTTRRYIAVNAAVLTGGGDNTGVDYFLRILA